MSTSSSIHFFFEKEGLSLRDRTLLKSFIKSIFRKEGRSLGSLTFIFCSDKRLLEINQQYLQHDYFTDIITFDLSKGKISEGEIYISVDRVRDNARVLNQTLKAELHRVIFHGILHLCGYGDKSRKDQAQMRSKEDHYVSKYFSKRST